MLHTALIMIATCAAMPTKSAAGGMLASSEVIDTRLKAILALDEPLADQLLKAKTKCESIRGSYDPDATNVCSLHCRVPCSNMTSVDAEGVRYTDPESMKDCLPLCNEYGDYLQQELGRESKGKCISHITDEYDKQATGNITGLHGFVKHFC